MVRVTGQTSSDQRTRVADQHLPAEPLGQDVLTVRTHTTTIARLDPEPRRRPRTHTPQTTTQLGQRNRNLLVGQLLHQTSKLLTIALRAHGPKSSHQHPMTPLRYADQRMPRPCVSTNGIFGRKGRSPPRPRWAAPTGIPSSGAEPGRDGGVSGVDDALVASPAEAWSADWIELPSSLGWTLRWRGRLAAPHGVAKRIRGLLPVTPTRHRAPSPAPAGTSSPGSQSS